MRASKLYSDVKRKSASDSSAPPFSAISPPAPNRVPTGLARRRATDAARSASNQCGLS
jgi:hypothetical protein